MRALWALWSGKRGLTAPVVSWDPRDERRLPLGAGQCAHADERSAAAPMAFPVAPGARVSRALVAAPARWPSEPTRVACRTAPTAS